MIEIAVAVVPLAALLVLSEILWSARLLRGEAARKLLHIIIGSYVASWPYFLSFRIIQVIALAMLIGVYLSHRLKVFHAINDVKRKTWGDLLYAAGVGLTALLTNEPWVFALAILHMSVADGLAGLIGTHYGKKNQYRIFGIQKSIVGSLTFAIVSLLLLVIFKLNGQDTLSIQIIFALPIVLTALENLGYRGTDNIIIPIFLTLLFR